MLLGARAWDQCSLITSTDSLPASAPFPVHICQSPLPLSPFHFSPPSLLLSQNVTTLAPIGQGEASQSNNPELMQLRDPRSHIHTYSRSLHFKGLKFLQPMAHLALPSSTSSYLFSSATSLLSLITPHLPLRWVRDQ